jgi:hypothetical protein
METAKPYVLIVSMIAIAFLLYFTAVPGEDQLLDAMVDTGPNITLDAWREIFKDWASRGIIVAACAALAWFILAQWRFNMNYWRNTNGKRWTWLSMMFFPLAATAAGFLQTPSVQAKGLLATLFYLANNIAVYYLATLLCSPSSFKYTPLGAAAVRRWW